MKKFAVRVAVAAMAFNVFSGIVPANKLAVFSDNIALTAFAENAANEQSIKECGDADTLKSLLQNASDGDIIKVTNDFNASSLVSAKVPVKEGCLVTLDLNGHTITFGAGGDVFGTQANSALLVKNGTMDYFDTDNNNSAGIIILCNVKVEDTAWLGSATTWVVNGSSISKCSSESGCVNPGSELHPIGSGYNSSYDYDNPAPAMIGSGVTWSCYQDLKTDFEKANADSSTNSNVLLLTDSELTADADLTASGIVMDFSEYTLKTGDHSFSITNDDGKNTIRNGTLSGDISMTSGSGNVSISNMTVTGQITNVDHAVEISGGFYNDISTGNGQVTITDGYYKGALTGSSYEISGGYFVNEPEKSFAKDGYFVFPCDETVNGVKYNFKVAEGWLVTFDANGGVSSVGSQPVEKGNAIGALPTAEYKKHSFDGWFTAPDEGTQITEDTVVSSDITWYAHWTPVYASVTVAPEAKKLTENGSAQELVTAGTAEGGKMQYAIGTDAETAPTEGYTDAIATGSKSGKYYVWYKAAGDENHFDSAPAYVEVDVAEGAKTTSSTTTTTTTTTTTSRSTTTTTKSNSSNSENSSNSNSTSPNTGDNKNVVNGAAAAMIIAASAIALSKKKEKE